MNIVYGGSFNPPQIAHKEIYNFLKSKFKPQSIIIMPVGCSYKKPSLIDGMHRFNMCKLNFKDAIISDLEINNVEYKGTKDTLDRLGLEDLYYVIGADNLVDLDTWINYKELLKKYRFIVFNRNHFDCDKIIKEKYSEYVNQFIIVDFCLDVSSSAIRENLEKNKHLLDASVYKYIVENKLYGGGLI